MIASPLSKTAKAAVARSQSIDQQLDEAREMRQREVQLLILGTFYVPDEIRQINLRVKTQGSAASGKSTFIKQLRIRHGDGFPLEERSKFTSLVFDNVCEALTIVLHNMEKYNIQFEDEAMKKIAKELLQSLVCPLPSVSQNSLKASMSCSVSMRLVMQLWGFEAVQECYKHRDEYNLSFSDCYFLDRLNIISAPNYVPSLQDILYIRKPTLGVQEHVFSIDKLTYRVIDVAGQKSHRKKWIHLFDCVSAVVFFSSLSSFCEKMEEEPDMNSLQDSLQLFKEVISNKFLVKTSFILFLNKKDLLEIALKRHPMTICFPHYSGDNNFESAVEFIKNEFMIRKPEGRHIYCHVSSATNIDLMENVIDEVMQIIIDGNVRKTKPL